MSRARRCAVGAHRFRQLAGRGLAQLRLYHAGMTVTLEVTGVMTFPSIPVVVPLSETRLQRNLPRWQRVELL